MLHGMFRVTDRTRFRALLPQALSSTVRRAMLLALAFAPPAMAQAPPAIPRSLDLSAIREMAVQYDGRWPPLDTVAREVVEEITGSMDYDGRDPVAVLLAWTFDPGAWQDVPLFAIENAELRRELELDPHRTAFSFTELVQHKRFMQLFGELHRKSEKEMDALDKEVSGIAHQLELFQTVMQGELIRPVPHPTEFGGRWRALGAGRPMTPGHPAVGVGAEEWSAVQKAFNADDPAAFDAAVNALLDMLNDLPAAHRPEPRDLKLEVHLNALQPYRIAFCTTLVAALVSGLNLVVYFGAGRSNRWLSVLSFAGIAVGFAFVSYGIGVRWHLAGRIPAANMYESMLFLAWGVGAFDIVAILLLRQPLVSFKSAVVAAGALALVNFVGLDWPIRPVAPVLLDTVWMAIHVPTIMVSYSVLFDAFVIAHIQLIVHAVAPGRRRLVDAIDQLHYWFLLVGSILLFAGIVTGSMWAALSWGRYWGWDPKEVWSLIAYVAYLAIMHVRVGREPFPGWLKAVCVVLVGAMFAILIHAFGATANTPLFIGGLLAACAIILVFVSGRGGAFNTAVKSVLAAWAVGMTYVGVNYVLGIGLHSYGFGTGRVVYWSEVVGGIDLGVLAVCIALDRIRSTRSKYALRLEPVT